MLIYIQIQSFCHSFSFDEPLHSSYTGVDSGLILLLNTTKRDYYYPLRNTLGFNVHVFNSREFPDVQTGSFLQLFVNPETEVFFKLDVTTVDAMLAVQQYSPVQRGCLFSHELGKYYGGHYSFADCLLKCKIKNIVALCNCMPYIYPTNFPDGTTSDVKCTLAHNKCLNRYKGEWRKMRVMIACTRSTDIDININWLWHEQGLLFKHMTWPMMVHGYIINGSHSFCDGFNINGTWIKIDW